MIRTYLALAAVACLFLSACGSALSSAASMRIEVDVYKGPLANSEHIQKGQLTAILRSARHSFEAMDRQLVESMCRIGCISEVALDAGKPPEDHLFYPSAHKCSQLAIPQRRVQSLTHYFDEFDEYAYTPLTDEDVPIADDKWGRSIGDGDPKAAVSYNTRNWISPGSRFPDLGGKNYQICPAYTRMRGQTGQILAILKKSRDLEVEGIQTGHLVEQLYGFMDSPVPDASIDLAKTMLQTIPGQFETVCAMQRVDDRAECLNTAKKLKSDADDLVRQYRQIDSDVPETQLLGGRDPYDFEDNIRAAAKKTKAMQAQINTARDAARQLKQQLLPSSDVNTFILSVDPYRLTLMGARDTPPTFDALANRLDTFATQVSSSGASDIAELLASLDALRLETAARKKPLTDARDAAKGMLNEMKTRLKGAPISDDLISASDLRSKLDTLWKSLSSAERRLSDFDARLARMQSRLSSSKQEIEQRASAFEALRTALERVNLDSSGTGLSVALNDVDAAFREVRDQANPSTGFENFSAALAKARDQNRIMTENADSGSEQSVADVNAAAPQLKSALTDLTAGPTLPSPDYSDIFPSADLASAISDLKSMVYDDPAKKSLWSGFAPLSAASAYEQVVSGYASLEAGLLAKKITPAQLELLAKLRNLEIALKEASERLEQPYDALFQIEKALSESRRRSETVAYRAIAELAGYMRLITTSLMTQLVSVEPDSQRLRIDIIKLATLNAEYSNQLTSRANALSQQSRGIDRTQLQTGQYLRDSSPTATINAYEWYEATAGSIVSPRARANISERLFDDDNWARINEAYASGAGDTTMAFIQDEIGNWNLKSFAADPGALVGAYTNLAEALIDKAVDLAENASTGGAAQLAESALELSNAARQVETNERATDLRTGALIGQLDLAGVRNDYVKRLEAVRAKLTLSPTEISEIRKAAQEGCEAAAPEVPQEPDLETVTEPNCEEKAEEAIKEVENQRRKEARIEAETVTNEYVQLIDALARVATIEPKD